MTPAETPVIAPGETFSSVSARVGDLVLERRTPLWWHVGTGLSLALFLVLVAAAVWLFIAGIGIWGVDIPVAWGFALANYVWWIGIASGGTFISSLFYIVGAPWRNGVNRAAESLTLFAAAAAGLMPIFHLGRPGLFYWLFPYPNVMDYWPQFRSPLLWDFFALACYVLNSIVFWYVGLIPDCATVRDRARTRGKQIFYGILAAGWRGSGRHWRAYKTVYLVMAGIMAPMVVSVHSIVGLDFAGGLIAGWHSTQWPPYFFIGALHSGWAAVLMIAIPMRRAYGLEPIITLRHLDALSKLMLTTAFLLGYCYLMEAFEAFYTSDLAKRSEFMTSAFGPYGFAFWLRNGLNILLPQLLWLPVVRRSPIPLWLISLGVVVGMWFERFSFVVPALAHDYIPSYFGSYAPTIWDYAILFGSCGLVLSGVFLFLRLLPVVSMFEIREVVEEQRR